MRGKVSKEELAESAVYKIQRIMQKARGADRYQIDKCLMDISVEKYWVVIERTGKVFCDCPGFLRQRFPDREHKHVKIALDYRERGEPEDAKYRIYGAGANNTIEYIQQGGVT